MARAWSMSASVIATVEPPLAALVPAPPAHAAAGCDPSACAAACSQARHLCPVKKGASAPPWRAHSTMQRTHSLLLRVSLHFTLLMMLKKEGRADELHQCFKRIISTTDSICESNSSEEWCALLNVASANCEA